MNIDRCPGGKEGPGDCNVIIEIPMRGDPIKYEVDKETGAVFVDRFMSTAMHYPCNYGYIPKTLSDDGDPVDVLVLTPFPLFPGAVVRCRTLGVLKLTDESGGDAKLLAGRGVKTGPQAAARTSYQWAEGARLECALAEARTRVLAAGSRASSCARLARRLRNRRFYGRCRTPAVGNTRFRNVGNRYSLPRPSSVRTGYCRYGSATKKRPA